MASYDQLMTCLGRKISVEYEDGRLEEFSLRQIKSNGNEDQSIGMWKGWVVVDSEGEEHPINPEDLVSLVM